ncbi:MAG TPA: hypothetical protein VFV38_35525 [Ktedonobacteraceae bacterium]|nr:hypothetical protein [Ktedonobacteraceae bacterium]
MQARFLSSRAQTREGDQQDLTAFCATCPQPAEVERLLEPLGLRLVFFLGADDTITAQRDLAPLPAQYHYEDAIGTSVAYLAGKDSPGLADDEEQPAGRVSVRYPVHASRFWLVPGGQELATRRVREALATAFDLRWLNLRQVEAAEDAA